MTDKKTADTSSDANAVTQTSPVWLSTKDVSKLLGKASSTLSRWRRENCGPAWCYSLPGNHKSAARYRAEDVQRFMQRTEGGV